MAEELGEEPKEHLITSQERTIEILAHAKMNKTA